MRCKITLKQLHASSVNRLAASYFFSVTGYGLLACLTALIQVYIVYKYNINKYSCESA